PQLEVVSDPLHPSAVLDTAREFVLGCAAGVADIKDDVDGTDGTKFRAKVYQVEVELRLRDVVVVRRARVQPTNQNCAISLGGRDEGNHGCVDTALAKEPTHENDAGNHGQSLLHDLPPRHDHVLVV